ncbi:MAG TPA: hypothetical protein VK489_14750 [Ferruginibacter sp.]|nr:hypothetical protein [Ferruginibacter sp.]
MKQSKIISTITCIACFLLLAGCQKEFSSDNGNPPVNPVNNDSVYLERITEVNYILDDSTIQNLSYDNQKRLTRISQKNYRNNILEDTSVVTLFYNGNDSLPFRYTDYKAAVGFPFFDSTNSFLFYDAQGRLVLDSAIYSKDGFGYSKDKDIYTIQYAPNKIYGYSTYTDLLNPGPADISLDTTWLDANKNIVKRHFYDSQPLKLFRTENNTAFDNKRSPYFYMRMIPYFILTSPYYTGMNNLLTTRVEKLYIFATYDVSYTHSYNSFNMPTLSVGIDIPTQAVEERVYYKYRSL